jgi:hypothetical protein
LAMLQTRWVRMMSLLAWRPALTAAILWPWAAPPKRSTWVTSPSATGPQPPRPSPQAPPLSAA